MRTAAVVRPNDTFVDVQKEFWDVVGTKMGVKFGAVAFNGRQLEIPWSNDEWGTGAVKMNFTTGYLILTWEKDDVFKVEIKRLNTRPATTVAAWLKRAILAKAAGNKFKLPPKENKMAKEHGVPQEVKDRAEEIKEKNPSYDEAKAFATAWSIYCKYTNSSSPHCKKDSPKEYFPSREARLRSKLIRLAYAHPEFQVVLLPLLR